ncbi:competence protein ComEC [Roseovarius nanhaiticus]|uniref:Competence protein ComEC n=1 Tax=Roseovarius nanhaiticus TaxID=573024 RepID=A0A1N7G870_9RHOB|nr:ComEC/Rec2 family competence protein [Roseovarius nanhaiticus]SEK34464.1 competence protein ComEC [Roseovarius nanhaiticus]SIS08801.1 competence protein ComEC [Roseovarius nanhaiticus]
MAALRQSFAQLLLLQRGHLIGWAPVCLATGIGLYFSLPVEPGWPAYAALATLGLSMLMLSRWIGQAAAPLAIGVALILAGAILAGARAHHVAGPVLGWRYYGPIEGRVVGIDRSASDAVRVTLDRVKLARVPPHRTPGRIRLSLHSKIEGAAPRPGLYMGATGHLSPPSGPVEPGGFDFQRHAWFQGLGAVGYTRVPLVALAPPEGGQWMFRIRMALSARVQAALGGETGGFAAAIMTGDRSGMGQDTLTALRVSNLAHLLAISGLHMGLLTAFVFAALRYGLALIPFIALRAPVKPVAAALALVVAAFYLGLSGGSIATERAFIMVAVMLVAVMLDRRALSLRAVALAALIVLVLRPEALMGPGFQMSFAATTALIAVFGWLQHDALPRGPKWLRPVIAVVVSSGVAGFATAPIAAAHFNQIAHYGLIANLASVPLMGVLVMPAAVLSVCLMPFGLEWVGLWIMGLGLDWILLVAHWISMQEGARGMVPSPGPLVLPLLSLGALTVILWQGRARLIGALPIAVAFLLWAGVERPRVLIADTGGLVGIMTPEGRALSTAKGDGFAALNWLENDGDPATQEEAAARWPAAQQAEDWPDILALRGKRGLQEVAGCGDAEWIVLNISAPEDWHRGRAGPDAPPCHILDPKALRVTGALAMHGSDLSVITARQVTGARLWNTARSSPEKRSKIASNQ